MSELALALQVAIRVHAAQVDRQGEPYLLHVLRVVEAVSDEAKVVAALHDVAEDSDRLVRDMGRLVLLARHEQQALALLTRGDGETYGDYIACLVESEGIGGEVAREVKLADLSDNLGRIPTRPALKLGEQYLVGRWDGEWASLKRRYERAVEALRAQEGER